MDWLPLPIFPEGSLRESVVTTVWIGVVVLSLFNLRFGWTYSGLVIPGYLVPLLLSNPLSAFITLGEGLIAYGLVRLLSEYVVLPGGWCNFFGRDRFFALFLSSVAVRVVMDGWVLPGISQWMLTTWHLALDYQGAFHSFGMIIIALIANQFWKPGLWRGLLPFATTLAVTFVLTRFVLMEWTNFNIGSVAYMYSDTAASLLASPKSYLILVITGFIASRMNLTYGWEFNGILIPALLALQWYEPLKIVSSLVEAGVVFLVSDFLLKLPGLRDTTMEGSRKLLLFFSVAYAYRFALGYLIPWLSPGVIVTDYYGFAYLLSSLIALKMHGKHIVIRLTRTTLQTSLVSALLANCVGLALATAFGSFSLGKQPAEASLGGSLSPSSEILIPWLGQEKVRMFQMRLPESVRPPTPHELNLFAEAMAELRQQVESSGNQPPSWAAIRARLSRLNYDLDLVEGQYLCLREASRERTSCRGWGHYVINLQAPRGLLVEVPAPLEEWAATESAIRLFLDLKAGALAIAGGARRANADGSSDALLNPNLPFQVFHRAFSRLNVLQVRGYIPDHLALLGKAYPALETTPASQPVSSLWVKSSFPPDLALRPLQTALGEESEVVWKSAPLPNAQQRATRSGFAELWLSRPARVRMKSSLLSVASGPARAPAIPGLGLPLSAWLLQRKSHLAAAGSNAYKPPLPEELLFLDEEVLTPLLDVVAQEDPDPGSKPEDLALIQAINVSAQWLGYECRIGETNLVLMESERTSPRRFWGTYVFRWGKRSPFVVQVPRPLYDLNTWEYSVHLFSALQAEALLLAGAHPLANSNGSADVLDVRNYTNCFSLVNQVILRHAGTRTNLVIQCRGYAPPAPSPGAPDVLLAFHHGIVESNQLTPLGRRLYHQLSERESLTVKFVDGSETTAGYEISQVPQAQYLNQAENKAFAVVWLSPVWRSRFRAQSENWVLQAALAAGDIPELESELVSCLAAARELGRVTRVPEGLKQALNRFVVAGDFVALRSAIAGFPQFRFARLLDPATQQIFLLMTEESQSASPAVLNLNPRSVEAAMKITVAAGTTPDQIRTQARDYLTQRLAWWEGGP